MNEYELQKQFFDALNKLHWLTDEEKYKIAQFVDEERMLKGAGAGTPLGIFNIATEKKGEK